MATEVFYRKWRPQTLAQVVGQEHITTTLANALTTGRVAHAYLFCGPRGTGKTSTGRILAKALNCLTNKGRGEPCNSCNICKAVNEGQALDLVEIDGASNTSVDDVRELREKINFAPNLAQYKVYIIDEVHMLSNSAFNALLKTLEEPPPHAIFILATTEVHKIPPTILSRCQRFDFRRLSQSAIVNKLKEICDYENIKIEPQALALVAKAATGSLRDAENILEQIVLYHGSNISLEQVRNELGLVGDLRIRQLAELIIKKNISDGLSLINSVAVDGVDLRQFTRGLVDYLRKLLTVKAGAEDGTDVTPEELKELKQLSSHISMADLSRVIRLFAQVDFRTDPQSTLPLELALVDSSLSETEKQQTVIPKGNIYLEPPISVIKPQKSEAPKELPKVESPVPEKIPVASAAEAAAKAPPQNVDQIRQRWSDFINACRGVGSSGNLDALLRKACEVIALEGDTLVLGFYWDFQRNKIEDPKYRHLVEDKLREVYGVPYHVRCILTPRGKEVKSQQQARNPVVNAALEMGARIITEEEHRNDE
jgi:DNA polymerase-3 subunit gamma/tau